jgi:aspartate racemase
MGPIATIDFLQKIIAWTPAETDQDHIPVVTYCNTQIPDRTDSIVENGPSPLPEMLASLDVLVSAGVSAVAIPCNTAYHWYEDLMQFSPVPIIHIADAVIRELQSRHAAISRVGLLGTPVTFKKGIYHKRVTGNELSWVQPRDYDRLMAAIRLVKSGNTDAARPELMAIVREMQAEGCEAIVLACSELPIALNQDMFPEMPVIDATAALARSCVEFIQAGQVS